MLRLDNVPLVYDIIRLDVACKDSARKITLDVVLQKAKRCLSTGRDFRNKSKYRFQRLDIKNACSSEILTAFQPDVDFLPVDHSTLHSCLNRNNFH